MAVSHPPEAVRPQTEPLAQPGASGGPARAPRRYNIIVNRPPEGDLPPTTGDGPEASAEEDVEDGFGARPYPTAKGAARSHPRAAAAPPDPELVTAPVGAKELAAVMAEGLGPQQLRLARRVATKRGLPAASDAEAVVRLRRLGLDPFARGPILGLKAGTTPPHPDAPAPDSAHPD